MGLEYVRMLTFYWTALFAHLQVQQAWLTPPHSTFCAICLHSALLVCTQLIFNALRSVCRGDIPALLSALPTLLSALPTLLPALPALCLHYLHFCLHYLHFVYTTYTFAYTTYTLSALPTLLSTLPTLLPALPTLPAHRSHMTQQHRGRVCRT